jgi:hypothetical protein
MICPIGGVITLAPGIDSPWKAMLYTARNTGWALMEGYFVGKILAGGGGALLANGAAGAGKYFLGNMLLMQGVSRTIGAADQVLSEGMLREGEKFGDAVKEHSVQGFTMFEQPFINIYKKATGQVKDPQGNDVPLNWQDFYGAALSVMATHQMTKAATVDVNMPKETMAAVAKFGKKIAAGIKGKAYEKGMSLPEKITKAQEAQQRAQTEFDNLGKKYKSKTVAADDIKTLSGWSEKPSGFTDVDPSSVKQHSDVIGHVPRKAGALDQVKDGGFDGKYNSSHAEKQLLTEKPNEPTGVSRDMCTDCQNFAKKQAIHTQKEVVVSDPSGTHVFHPDGSFDFIPK